MIDLHRIADPGHENEVPDRDEMSDQVKGLLEDPGLTTQEKRAVLASWASDANAVPDMPALRQLQDGSVVNVGDILRALSALDQLGQAESANESRALLRTRPFTRRKLELRRWTRSGRRWDDDDDPPPCPAYAPILPKGGAGPAFARAEPVPA